MSAASCRHVDCDAYPWRSAESRSAGPARPSRLPYLLDQARPAPLAEHLWLVHDHPMTTSLDLDPSYPCQTSGDLLALWLPRGRGRDALAEGLIATVDVCDNPACRCTIARLHALRVDDRAVRVVHKGGKMRVTWQDSPDGPPHPSGSASLELDIATGAVEAAGGGELPDVVAPLFEEPLPFWVLDHMWAMWREPRLPSGIDWQAQGLTHWEPGTLLPTMVAFPEERPDRYIVDGRQYMVDPMFCVEPGCTCTEARLSVLEFNEDENNLKEVASAQLPPETMMPAGYVDDGLGKGAFADIYLQWRRRNVPARERLLELRDLTRQRGLELHRLAEECSRAAPGFRPETPTSRPVRKAKRPGRNAPCPCGSG